MDEYGDEYEDEVEEDKEEEEDKDALEEEPKEQPLQEAEAIAETTPGEELKEGEEEESEYDEEAYGEEDYDEEGKYIWGKEGAEWDYYYKEDKEANERGDPIHPDVINQGQQLDLPDNLET